jgi:MFS family permease
MTSTDPPVAAVAVTPAMLAAVLQTVLGILPAFLLGAMSVQIRTDIGLTASQLGGAVMVFFLVSGLVYAAAGSFIERLGTVRATTIGVVCATASLMGIGIAPSRAWIPVLLVVGGPGNAASQLAANLRLAQVISRSRQGLAFGTKQGAVPLAAFLGGLAVPAVALTVGWRLGFLGAAALAIPVVMLNGRTARNGPRAGTSAGTLLTARHHLWALAVAAGLGTAATNVLAVFYVDAVVLGGTDAAMAGLLLAAGSILGALVRVLVGWSADRRAGRHLVVVAVMLAVSAGGYAALAGPPTGPMLLAATAVTFITGWGWNGLLTYAVIRFNPTAPAQATGITQAGVSVGGALGPAVAGMLASQGSYAEAWLACAGAVLVAAVLVVLTRGRMVRADRARAAAPPVSSGVSGSTGGQR